MASLNRVILAGNLTRDPQLRFTNDGVPVCSFGLAVNRVRSKQGGVDYFDINAWRELGEAVANYKKKGDGVIVEGRLQYPSWKPRASAFAFSYSWRSATRATAVCLAFCAA
jgi:single-strand DNA-binding protein